MKKILTFIVTIWVCSHVLQAQNLTQYNHYIANQGILNPGYNGTRDVISGILLHRSQWVGMEGAPFSEALNVHGPIEDTNLGVGGFITNDHIGFTNTFEFFGAGSYKLQVDRDKYVSLGLQLGVGSMTYDGTQAINQDFGDPVFAGKQVKTTFNAGFGAYFFAENYFAGYSVPRFFSNTFDSDKQQFKNTFDLKNQHHYLYGGYIFEWGEVMVKPTMLARIVPGAPLEFDFSGNVLLMEKVWVGLSYRTMTDMVFLAEYIIDRQFTVRYSFDYALSEISNYAKFGSHEISLQFDFSFQKRAGMRSIRYF